MSFLKTFRRLGATVREIWNKLDYIPNCPMCGGTGEYKGDPGQMWDIVWWKGTEYVVCFQCQGKGKV